MGIFQSSETSNKTTKRKEFISQSTGHIQSYYDIIRHLDIGSTGAVYYALDLKTHLPRAIKEIRKSTMTDLSYELLYNEIEILKSLDHPNIMKIYEVIESPYAYYIVCEVLHGRNLMEMILNDNYRPSEDVIAMHMDDILYAISYCHSQGVIHNDIRPDNLVFESDSENAKLKIIDFGIAQRVSEQEFTNDGQLHFRAPETFLKFRTPAVDVWSAGVIFYILLTGRSLVIGSNEKNIRSQIDQGLDPNIFRDIEASEDAIDLLKQMLEFDENKRIRAQDALRHPFFQQIPRLDDKSNVEAVLLMKDFKNQGELFTKMIAMISTQMLTSAEEIQFGKNFRNLDSDSDGVLGIAELTKNFVETGLVSEEDINYIFGNSNLSDPTFITYTEFLTISIHWKELLKSEKLDVVIDYFDILRKGALTRNQLMKIFKGVDKAEWNEFFNKVDENNDGVISKQELQIYFLDMANDL